VTDQLNFKWDALKQFLFSSFSEKAIDFNSMYCCPGFDPMEFQNCIQLFSDRNNNSQAKVLNAGFTILGKTVSGRCRYKPYQCRIAACSGIN